jgi:uncharacterized protein
MQPREHIETKMIEATGSSVVRAKPDAAKLRLGVTTQAEKPADAVKENAERMTKVIAAVKAQKIPESAIQTSELQLEPVTKWDEDLQTDLVVGYRATNIVTVQTPVERAVAVYDSGVAAGVNTASGLAFIVADEKKYRRESIALATKVAVEEIDAVAKALGTTLDGPLQAQVVDESRPPIYDYNFMAPEKLGASTPIIPGQLEIATRVRVVYAIKVA